MKAFGSDRAARTGRPGRRIVRWSSSSAATRVSPFASHPGTIVSASRHSAAAARSISVRRVRLAPSKSSVSCGSQSSRPPDPILRSQEPQPPSPMKPSRVQQSGWWPAPGSLRQFPMDRALQTKVDTGFVAGHAQKPKVRVCLAILSASDRLERIRPDPSPGKRKNVACGWYSDEWPTLLSCHENPGAATIPRAASRPFGNG